MNHIRTLQALAVATLALSQAACGGGGGGGGGTDNGSGSPVVQATAALQGIWQSAPGAASTLSAIAMPDGQLWTIISNGAVTRLIKASLSAQATGFSGSGKGYTLGASTASSNVSATATASVVEKTSLTGSLAVGGAQAEPFALAYQARYDTPAVLSEFAGAWQATLGPGVVTWTIDSTGALSGARTTGCTYSGKLSLRAEQKAVLDATVAESCAGAAGTAVQQLGGVAVFNADKTRITMLLTTTDETTGVVVSLGR